MTWIIEYVIEFFRRKGNFTCSRKNKLFFWGGGGCGRLRVSDYACKRRIMQHAYFRIWIMHTACDLHWKCKNVETSNKIIAAFGNGIEMLGFWLPKTWNLPCSLLTYYIEVTYCRLDTRGSIRFTWKRLTMQLTT